MDKRLGAGVDRLAGVDGENFKHPFEASVVEEGVSLGAFGILPVAAQVALWDTEEGVEQKDGRPGPVTPWGKPALGYKTRKTKNKSDKYIVRRRSGK